MESHGRLHIGTIFDNSFWCRPTLVSLFAEFQFELHTVWAAKRFAKSHQLCWILVLVLFCHKTQTLRTRLAGISSFYFDQYERIFLAISSTGNFTSADSKAIFRIGEMKLFWIDFLPTGRSKLTSFPVTGVTKTVAYTLSSLCWMRQRNCACLVFVARRSDSF